MTLASLGKQSRSPFSGKIKIFADGAERNAILEFASRSDIHGFTTNPSLMRKAGVQDYRAYSKQLLQDVPNKPFSFEVFADDFAEMKKQALEIATWGKNVYVKIPIMNTKAESAIPLIQELSHQGIPLNVTALLTLEQVWETTRALKGGAPSIVSVFAGRIADTGRDPMPIMTASAEMCESAGDQVELLWASSREPLNIVQAELAGAKIITVTPEIARKMAGFNKDLFQLSLDTVKAFKSDSDAAGFTL